MSSSVASPPAARPAPPPPARHGTCRWHVYITPAGQTGGKLYSVIPLGPQPGFRATWRLTVQETHPARTYTVAAPKSGRPGCTCPDHETRGTICKHIRALGALGLLKLPKDKPAPSAARARKAHAKTARKAINEAKQLPAETRRHLAVMGPEPGSVPGTARRVALAGMPPARDLERDLDRPAHRAPDGKPLPEGWQLGGDRRPVPAPAPPAKTIPPAPEGSFTADFRAAVKTHLAVRRGDLIECAACRYPFDPATEGSAAKALCGPCLDEEGGAR